jgi:perosamine synthetase
LKSKVAGSFDVGTIFDSEDLRAVRDVLESGQPLTRGPKVSEFEVALQKVTQSEFAVACSSCTAALRLGFQALGLQTSPRPVITQVNSFWNTLVALIEFNCPIIFVDCGKNSLSIDIEKLTALLSPGHLDSAILLITDFGGHPSDYTSIKQLALRHELTIVSDGAHALGSRYEDKAIGALADIACFSFSTLKNISTLGEGGAMCTNSQRIADDARKLRECWPLGEYKFSESAFAPMLKTLSEVDQRVMADFFRPGTSLAAQVAGPLTIGTNLKLSAVQAAVGITQLKKLEDQNERRRTVSEYYREELRRTAYKPIMPDAKSSSSWHLFNSYRDDSNLSTVLKTLKALSDFTGSANVNRYWPAFDLSALKSKREYNVKDFPNYTDLFFGRLLSLPINPRMTIEDVRAVVDILVFSER